MMLLVTSSPKGPDYKISLQTCTGERVHLVSSLSDAVTFARERHYTVVVIDEELAHSDPQTESALIHAACFAVPVYINFSICGTSRFVSEIKAAPRRHHAERVAAMRIASSELRHELRGAVTGILLSSELAMSVPELPRAAQVKIKFVHDLAQGIRRQLEA
jgi:signal transduction histidine kinase